MIIGKKPYLTTYQGGGPPPNNEKIQVTVVQHPEILILCGCNRFFFGIAGVWEYWQKTLLDTFKGGGGGIMKKNKLLWCNSQKF